MAIRTIRKEGDPILRKRSREVSKIDERIHQLFDDMIETMDVEDGVGLAAPQVGVLKRAIVIKIGENLIQLINPEITYENGQQTDIEGCLSVPGVSRNVKRPLNVKVEGINREGKMVEYEGSDLLARAFCHEVDHLNGILFIDKGTPESE
ncbi:MAG: peptide deformylase [Peptostreptococcaceae bacterium]|nr:peptide deformylase [Peptostreptococcaceae bacterium]